MARIARAEIAPQELDELIVRAATPAALSASRLRSCLPAAYRPGEAHWRELLARLVALGRLHRWPVRRGLYAAVAHEEFARQQVRAALSDGPLGKGALERRTRVGRRVLDKLLPAMSAAGELHPHPGRRYGTRPPDDLDYVLRPDLEQLAGRCLARGASAEAVRAAVARWARPAAADEALLGALRELNPQVATGDLVYLPHLRTALKDRFPDKVSFDRAVLALAEQRRVQLQSHPVPAQIKPAERESMIEDGSGSFYMVIGLRR